MKVGPSDGDETVDMGPGITRAHLDRVAGYLDVVQSEGAEVALDGRELDPSRVTALPDRPERAGPGRAGRCGWRKEEIFGPVLSVIRVA